MATPRLFTSTPTELAQHLKRFLDHAGSTITGAWVSGAAPALTVTIRRSFKDATGASTRRTLQSYTFHTPSGTWASGGPPVPLAPGVVHVAPSPSGARLALLRTEDAAAAAAPAAPPSAKAKLICELWDVACGALLGEAVSEGLHGAALADGWFSEGLSWSPCERFTAYVAEALPATPAGSSDKDTFFTALSPAALAAAALKTGDGAAAAAAAAAHPILGTLGSGRNAAWEAGGKEDWGEKYVGVRCPRPFVVDWRTLRVHGLGGGVPATLSLGQPVFAPPPAVTAGVAHAARDEVDTVYGGLVGAVPGSSSSSAALPLLLLTGWPAANRRLGLIHCFNRPCSIYAVPLASLLATPPPPSLPLPAHRNPLHCLTPTFPIARSPRVSPDGHLLACLTMTHPVCLQTHNGPSSLTIFPFPEVAAWVASSEAVAAAAAAAEGLGHAAQLPAPPPFPPLPTPTPANTSNAPFNYTFPGFYAASLPAAPWDPHTPGLLSIATAHHCSTHIMRVQLPLTAAAAAAAPAAASAAAPLADAAAAPLTPTAFGVSYDCNSDENHEGWGVRQAVDMRLWGTLAQHTLYSIATPTTPERLLFADAAAGCTHPLSPSLIPATSPVQAALQHLQAVTLSIYPKRDPPGALTGSVATGEAAEAPFQATLLWCSAAAAAAGTSSSSLPLLLVPHGGPHSSFVSSFSPHYAHLASLGMAVLLVNFRGSTGYPLETLASLPGRCGVSDVSDCFQATLAALAWGGCSAAQGSALLDARNTASAAAARHQELLLPGEDAGAAGAAGAAAPTTDTPPLLHFPRLDPSRVAISGGSHGGFIAAHLISNPVTRPLFRTAILRNPVTNMASMVGATDIPDWCSAEALGVSMEEMPARTRNLLFSAAGMEQMRRMSPISNVRFLDTEGRGGRGGGGGGGAGSAAAAPAEDARGGAASAGAGADAATTATTTTATASALPTPTVEDGLLPTASLALGSAAAAISGTPRGAQAHATPLLLMLGLKDRRVPPSQGFELFHAVRAVAAASAMAAPGGGAPLSATSAQLLVYPEDTHALESQATDGDSWVHLTAWLAHHLR